VAFAFVQTKQTNTAGATSLAVSPLTAVGANHLLVINIKFGAQVSAISITDNASTPNSYFLARGPVADGVSAVGYQFYGVALTSGATSVTVSWTTSASARITVDEFSGNVADNKTVFDRASNGSAASGATTGAVTSFSTYATGELISAGVFVTAPAGTVTAGSGYTLAQSTGNGPTQYKLSSGSSETAPISWTSAIGYVEIAGAYSATGVPKGNFFVVM
jgi:hypothetical protein